MADYSSLEKLYTKGILDMNPKDYMNGTNSNTPIKPREDVFLPDSRFVTIDGNYMRNEIDKDIFQKNNNVTITSSPSDFTSFSNEENKTRKISNKITNALTSKYAAGIAGILAFILSGRYILKKIHILK